MTDLSRGELISWVNDLTQLNIPKVESMGTGAAHCLIIYSIFGDVPVHKVNFKAIHEYEYVHNFKVLQEAFTRHRIDRTIPVDRLIKLKFQDNLEFLQWIKKYWDTHCDGASVAQIPTTVPTAAAVVERRTSAPNTRTSTTISTTFPVASKLNRSSSINANPKVVQLHQQQQQQHIASSAPAPIQATNSSNNSNAHSALQLAALTKTITELKLSVDEMEKERDFYFNKLRDIEILTQKITEPEILSSLFFKQITEILYTTEEGFEIPQDGKEKSSLNTTTVDTIMT